MNTTEEVRHETKHWGTNKSQITMLSYITHPLEHTAIEQRTRKETEALARPQNTQFSRPNGGVATQRTTSREYKRILLVASEHPFTSLFRFKTMKVSAALAEIVSDFSGFHHIHASKSSPASSSSHSATSSSSSRLNITVGVVIQGPSTTIRRTDSLSSIDSTTSNASYVLIE
ncbi:unnamed protein product [Caenorhabditis sp. 36 PRJEB53466]|nr:unnamed protein product [Caenorhabditis sp. 36 PRJEB53466]